MVTFLDVVSCLSFLAAVVFIKYWVADEISFQQGMLDRYKEAWRGRCAPWLYVIDVILFFLILAWLVLAAVVIGMYRAP
jgi:hypothetical protein